MKKIYIFILLLFSIFTLVSCVLRFEEYYYTVTWDLNGGVGNLDPIRIKEGSKLVDPIGIEYVFHPEDLLLNGWSLNPYGGELWNFTYNTVNEDMTLYAQWIDSASYMDNVASWANPGWLYIHYERHLNSQSDYGEWNVWLWAFAPKRYEGITMEFTRFDASGAVAGLDIMRSYDYAGWRTDGKGPDNLYADFEQLEMGGLQSVGFLIVYKSSKAKTIGMWQSDGGNTYVTGIKAILDDFGSVHIFCKQDIVGEYTVNRLNNVSTSNPYENLKPHEGNSNYLPSGIMPGISNSMELIKPSANYTYVNSSLDNSTLKTKTSEEFYGVGYQIQVSSFADSNGDGFGDIRGITNNLDYLATLGVKVLWLTPIQLANNYHGYDIIDFYEIDPRFGTLADASDLVTKAHSRGMKVIMDLVMNHTANNAKWFKDSALFKTIDCVDKNGVPYTASARSLYTWRDDPQKLVDNDNEPIWYPYSTYGYYYYSSFSSNMPELNFDYQPTRDAFISVAVYWLDFGFDGFRLDAVKHIYTSLEVQSPQTGDVFAGTQGNRYEANVTKNNNFFNEFCARVKQVKPHCFIVGENFDGNNDNIAPYVKSIDSQFSFPALYSISSAISSASSFNANPNGGFQYYQNGYYQFKNNRTSGVGGVFIDSPFTSNHDVIRAINFVSGAPIGHAGGRNIKAVLRDYYQARAKVWASIVLTLPGLPWIFYGDELGMSSNLVPNEYGNIYSYMDRFYRQPFKWEYLANSQTTHFYVEAWEVTWDEYNKTLFGVKEQLLDSGSMLNHYRALINLKMNNQALLKGDVYLWTSLNNGVLIYERVFGSNRVLIYHNVNDSVVSNYQYPGYVKSSPLWVSLGSSSTTLTQYGSAIYVI